MRSERRPRGCFGTTKAPFEGGSAAPRGRAGRSFKIGAPSRRRSAPARAKKTGVKNGRDDVDTHHLRGGTIRSGSPVLLQRNGLVSSLPLLMRARTSHGRYHHSWAHPAILPYIKTCTTSHTSRVAAGFPFPTTPSPRRLRNPRLLLVALGTVAIVPLSPSFLSGEFCLRFIKSRFAVRSRTTPPHDGKNGLERKGEFREAV